MMLYEVRQYERWVRTVLVEAESEQEALSLGQAAIANGKDELFEYSDAERELEVRKVEG